MHRRLAIPLCLMTALAAGCETITPAEAVRLMDDKTSADARREGIAYLVTHFPAARVPPYPAHYQQIARADPDFIVRAMAIRALNICRDASATPIFIAALNDDNAPVRLEAAKALANLPDPAAVPDLLRLVRGRRASVINGSPVAMPEDRDVRVAAADALRRYPTLDVERTLVSYLGEPEFPVAWQARQSLVALTGQDLRYDEAAWLRYLVKTGM